MIEYLIQHRDRYYLSLDPELLERLGFDEGTPLAVSGENGRLVITPAAAHQGAADESESRARRASLAEALKLGIERYPRMLGRLSE